MIQKGTYVNVIDNSGARKACCIHVYSGYKRRYASVGDIILVSIKTLRAKRRLLIKAKKGMLFKALVVRVKTCLKSYFSYKMLFLENSIVLLTKQNKLFATRIFGALPKQLRYTKYSKVISVSSGLI